MKKLLCPSLYSVFLSVCTTFQLLCYSTQAAVIADSAAQFSGTNGANGWLNGYRDVTADAKGINYDSATDFIPFPGGADLGTPWDGGAQTWSGTAWDLNTAAAAPWTFISVTNIHPNGTNNAAAPSEHWAIRRWNSDSLTGPTPIAITWHMRKQNLAGNGVSGGIHINGARADWVTIAGTNGVGVTRTYYVNADFGTNIDLAISPVGIDGSGADGSDGSFNWMTIDTTIPAVPRQPDGTIFIPHGSPDTDSDGLPDIWENAYSTNNLAFFNATTDRDGDGLNETQEFQRSTDPTDTDTDDDGLRDGVESNSGTFVGPNDTGTHPRDPDTDDDGRTDGAEVIGPPTSNPLLTDTDGDGFSDGNEISTGHDPSDPNHNQNTTAIADSRTQFSGVQGQDSWFYGYRNFTVDGAGLERYDPTNHFIQFAGGSDLGTGWDGTTQMWSGSQWDLNTAAAGPWTEIGPQNVHPNGVNSAPNQTHWTVRRWVATNTSVTPYALRWNVRKSNLNGSAGNGVTGGIYINGQRADTATINFNDGVGPTRTYYANLGPGARVDLILTPRGPNGNDQDGSDGSAQWLVVDPTLPTNPIQPDGTPFVPATGSDTDGDGLLDAWERIYSTNLTTFTGTGDNDTDGLNNIGEFTRDSDPTKADTDGDGLSDRVETKTGTFVSANDTGSNPRQTDSDNDGLSDSAEVNATPATNPSRADTDGDSFSDPAELAEGTNPTDPADNPLTFVIAASDREFSGVQGSNNWFNGYRNYTTDGGTTNYDSVANFIAYEGGAGLGPFGPGQFWTGSAWSLNTGGNGPWTSQGAVDTHPNGVNSAPNEEHWAIRRWVASGEITNPTPVAVIWRIYEVNTGGSGVSGSLHVDGRQVDAIAIAGGNTTNPVRRFYITLYPTNVIDLAITPVGAGGDRGDGADGSATWFWVDTRLPKEPRQPDGTLFIPPNSPDTDADGLVDFWELVYATNLTTFTGTGDNDGDGLNNTGEFQRDSNPLLADTDGDGLSDRVETKTGIFVSATDTGSNPRQADTDGDTYNDAAEVGSGKDPNDPTDSPAIANSFAEFSGTQGQADWYYGYRDLSLDGGTNNYDPVVSFIQFDPATQWNGTFWDLNTAAAAPWTELGRENTHPNGDNNGPVHWTIRRWVGGTNDLTAETPVAFKWHIRKSNTGGGNGVTGAIFINGQLLDTFTIAGTDGVGTNRTYYAYIRPTDIIDLVHTPRGTDDTNADGADGSFMRLLIDTVIPPNATQPDGTPFGGTGTQPRFLSIVNAPANVTLTWSSSAGKTYTIDVSTDLATWTSLATGHASGGAQTSYVRTFPAARPAMEFYRVRQEN